MKGEITFEARRQTFTFKLGVNAQAMIEDKTGMSMPRFLKERFDTLGAKDVRLIFWAGLFRQHQMTEDDVGDLIDELGPARVGEIFTQAFSAATPQKTNGADDQARPMKAKAPPRIGMAS
jgi:hypothetical protein